MNYAFCPLTSNADVRNGLNYISSATDQNTAYQVWVENHANGIDKAPNGAKSNLFLHLLDKVKDEVVAIRIKADIYTERFKKKFGDWNNNPNPRTSMLRDENGEPIPEFLIRQRRMDAEARVSNFLDRLETKSRPYNPRKNISKREDFYKDLNDAISKILHVKCLVFDLFDKIVDVKGNIDLNVIRNKINQFVDNELDNLLSVDMNNTRSMLSGEQENGEILGLDIVSFLKNKGWEHPEDYRKETIKLFKLLIPEIFKYYSKPHGKSTAKSTLAYKRLLAGKLLHNRKELLKRAQEYARSVNLTLKIAKMHMNSLNEVKTALETIPNIRRLIQFSLTLEAKRRCVFYLQYYLNSYKTYVKLTDLASKASDRTGPSEIDSINLYLKGLKPNSAKEVLNVISQFAKDPYEKKYIKAIQKYIDKHGDINLYYIPIVEVNRDGSYNLNTKEGVLGYYNESNDYHKQNHYVYIIISNNKDLSRTTSVILHELTHYITNAYILRNPKVRGAINQLIDEIKKSYAEMVNDKNTVDLLNIYGFEWSWELPAEFASNKDLRNLLRSIKPADSEKFNLLYKLLTGTVYNALNISAADLVEAMIDAICKAQYNLAYREEYVPLELDLWYTEHNSGYGKKDIVLHTLSELELDENEASSGEIEADNEELTRWKNGLQQDKDDFVGKAMKEELENNPDTNLQETEHKARKAWIESRLHEILLSTQLKLMQAYGIHKDENGNYVGNNNLIIQFLRFIDGADGYYDHNSRSYVGHHVIALALNTADPATFNHELAHFYVRMFWNSKAVQTALSVVSKEGMTDEEREEALVDMITAKSTDPHAQDKHMFSKFWDMFAEMLYKTFGISNKSIKNSVMNNITRAFMINKELKLLDTDVALYNMANKRMFSRKSYEERLQEARKQKNLTKSFVEYQPIQRDKVLTAIKRAIQGTVSRNKSYRQEMSDSETITKMQLLENEVRDFAELVLKIRELQAKAKCKSNSELSKKDRYDISHSKEERIQNVQIILSILDNAKDELSRISEMMASMKTMKYAQYLTRETVDDATGEVVTEYLDISHVKDKDVVSHEITWKEILDIYQNTLGFYQSVFDLLKKAVRDPLVRSEYADILDENNLPIMDVISADIFGISDNPRIAEGFGISRVLDNIEFSYSLMLLNHISQFTDKYIDEHVDLEPKFKERMKDNIRTWLDDQNVFGDIGSLETWVGLASESQSPIIRILQDIIDDMMVETHETVEQKGADLRDLRKKAYKKLTILGIPYRNAERLFMETTDDGFSGNFISEINNGLYRKDKMKFIDNLLYGRNGILDKIRARLNDNNFELEIGEDGYPIFPEECTDDKNQKNDIERMYLRELNHWVATHAHRPYTEKYYNERIRILSSKTRRAQSEYNNQIDRILSACRDEVTGRPNTSKLPPEQQRLLKRLYYLKSQLSNIYDAFGREKTGDDRLIADELQEWGEFTKDKIAYKTDEKLFKEASDAATNKNTFNVYNTYRKTNPKIWDYITKLYGENSKEYEDLIQKRRLLVSVIKQRGLVYPTISLIWDNENGRINPAFEEFWKNLKDLDEQLWLLRNKNPRKKDKSKSKIYDELIGTSETPYHDKITGLNTTWFLHIQSQVAERVRKEHPNDPRIKELIEDEMAPFYAVERGKDGLVKAKHELFIFSMHAPVAIDPIELNGETIDPVVIDPIQAYSQIDVENSNDEYVDKYYDTSNRDSQQPFTDDDLGSGDVQASKSYTNHQYNTKILNGDPDVKAYFDALKKTMEDAYTMIPFAGLYDGRLPQIGESAFGLFRRPSFWKSNFKNPLVGTITGAIGAGVGAIAGLTAGALFTSTAPFSVPIGIAAGAIGSYAVKYKANREWGMPNEMDFDINTDYETRPDGKRSMNIPVRFLKRLANPNLISTDVLGNVLKFYLMAYNYKVKSKKLPLFQSFLNRLNENTETTHTNQRKFINGLINRQFFEKNAVYNTNDEDPKVYNKPYQRWGLKVLLSLRAITQTGLLALGYLPALVSYVDPLVSIIIDSFTKRYISKSDLLIGTLRMLANLPQAMLGLNSTRSYGLIPSAIRHFAMHKIGAENFSGSNRNRLTKRSWSDIVMTPFELGEYTLSGLVVGAVFRSYRWDENSLKYYNREEWIKHAIDDLNIDPVKAEHLFNFLMQKHTLFDAYEVETGTGLLKPKENKYGNAITKDFDHKIGKIMRNRFRLYALTVKPTEKTKLQTNVLFTYTLVMRTFMIPGFISRFQTGHDLEGIDDTEYDENQLSKIADDIQRDQFANRGYYSFLTGLIYNGLYRGFWNALWHGRYWKYAWYNIKHPFRSKYNQKSIDKRESLGINNADTYGVQTVLGELGLIALLSLSSVLFHNRVANDDDPLYWVDILDILLFRLVLERITFYSFSTLSELITTVSASISDVQKKAKFINLISDLFSAVTQHGWNADEWDKVKGGAFNKSPKVLRDICLTFSSLGFNNAYRYANKDRLQYIRKYYMQHFWTPATPFYNKKDKKKSSELKKQNKTTFGGSFGGNGNFGGSSNNFGG